MPFGIEKIGVYPCSFSLEMKRLCEARKHDLADIRDTMMIDERSVNPAWEDPVTMAVKEYRLPDPDARPRRIAITADDMVWYTDFARGYLGRLNPATGEVKEWRSPSGTSSEPYGIAVAKGALWYNESGPRPNTLVRFDPATQTFQSWLVPSGGVVIRNMMTTRDGNLAIASSGANKVGVVEIK